LAEALVGGFQFNPGAAEFVEGGVEAGDFVLRLAQRAAGARLAGGSDDRLGGGGEADPELFDDGVEFDAGQPGTDALADIGVVEAGPGGGFALAGPEEAEETPVL